MRRSRRASTARARYNSSLLLTPMTLRRSNSGVLSSDRPSPACRIHSYMTAFIDHATQHAACNIRSTQCTAYNIGTTQHVACSIQYAKYNTASTQLSSEHFCKGPQCRIFHVVRCTLCAWCSCGCTAVLASHRVVTLSAHCQGTDKWKGLLGRSCDTSLSQMRRASVASRWMLVCSRLRYTTQPRRSRLFRRRGWPHTLLASTTRWPKKQRTGLGAKYSQGESGKSTASHLLL